ncbi:hypothetical protein PAT3040_00488 [Paenibacillus agaridevorans]|uniref:Uncharacterized protein n=1 Tax=Paenibacillus agaridevorans TaxID=171404 RepID=A0A2R5EHL6_9BACL|nr:hypothetical protein PAT3040_00488 [Paenibacillus agaridevorans]
MRGVRIEGAIRINAKGLNEHILGSAWHGNARGHDHICCESQANIEVNHLRIPDLEVTKAEKKGIHLPEIWDWMPFFSLPNLVEKINVSSSVASRLVRMLYFQGLELSFQQ